MTTPRSRRRVGTVATLFVVVLAWWLAAPQQLGGRTVYVTTHGVSMVPEFHAGDLAVVRPADSYHVGDIAAYRSRILHGVVLHRIVAEADGRYTFKGDNNSWQDPERPRRSQVVGKVALRLPHSGLWLRRATSPAALAALAFVLIVSGGAAAQNTRSRRKKTVSRHAVRSSSSAPLRVAALAAVAVGVLGAGAGALAWSRPVSTSAAGTSAPAMRFSYAAAVGRSPAYDSAAVSSPDPVFRKLAQTVDVTYTYSGDPGSVSVYALLSTASGWHSTVPLAPATRFSGRQHEGSVRLDLPELQARAEAAAAVTGIPAGPVTVVVMPRVQAAGGISFRPTLTLTLTPLQLTLVGSSPQSVVSADVVPRAPAVAATLGWQGRAVAVTRARTGSVLLVFASLLGGAGLLLLARRRRGLDETVVIGRRYRSLLAQVHPMPLSSGQRVIDVTEFATLARVAERDAHPVLHWVRSNVGTYIVQDGNSTYRYRTGQETAPESADGESGEFGRPAEREDQLRSP